MTRSGPSESNPQPPAKRRALSLSMVLGIAGLVFFAAVFIAVAVFTTGGDPETGAAADSQGVVLGVSTEPAVADPTFSGTLTATPVASIISATPTVLSVPGDPRFPTTSASQPPTPTALSTSTTPAVATSPTVGSATATPVATATTPSATLSAAASALASQIETEFSVRVITDGQDWGTDEQKQLRTLGAVQTALESIPTTVVAEIVAGPGGPLTYLSNNHGSTADGWEPYGDRAANYYSNEDRSSNGSRQANQIVLQTGSTAQTIAHEMAHAYQMRGIAPGQYADSLLTPEMKSFMAATGWTQLVSDDELRENANRSWATINAMFRYDGRDLSYVNEFGTGVTLYAPNPLEGYAEAAGLYYAHSVGTTLPQWPEYWDWLAANLG